MGSKLLLLLAVAAFAAGCGDDDGGDRAPATKAPQDAAALRLSTSAFINGSRLPERYTCDGAGEEPSVQAGTVPPSTRELVLVVADPDAPGGDFVHVTRYGLSRVGDGTVSEGGTEGRNSADKVGWTPPCPPKGNDPHHYVWSVYALRDPTNLQPGAKPAEVLAAVGDGVLAHGTITALYGR
jgi:Raf kinase inhibitor-like YbhB/YbcL family protein